ncbi:MAG: ATP-dependent helicase C-terminal domain-containing protein, partial [Pseudomonadota bacterium]
EAGMRGLPAEPAPEILQANLAGLALALAEWGERDAARLTWIDPPPPGRFASAREELCLLGAIDAEGALTDRGREIAALPLEPRLAAMIAGAPNESDRALAAEIAALIGERGLGGDSVDLRERLERFRRDSSPRARALREQAARWAKGAPPSKTADAGRIIAIALPHLIARAKPETHGDYLTAGGRAARLQAGEALANERWLAVADLVGSASNARILAAAPLCESDALALGKVETIEVAEFDIGRRAFRARRVKRLGAIVLAETPLPSPSGEAARRALVDALGEHGFQLLDNGEVIHETKARLALARTCFGEGWPEWSDAELLARAGEWLTPLLGDPPDFSRPSADQLRRALMSLLDWSAARTLDEIAPLSIETPAGRKLPVDYLDEGGPMIEARVQEFYGLAAHPAIMRGRIALAVSLLSPARRQIAVTKDLPAFWRGGYRDMAKDMRGEYPKHDWPDDPANARAHEGKTKARLAREK